jgi:hypothetical protein
MNRNNIPTKKCACGKDIIIYNNPAWDKDICCECEAKIVPEVSIPGYVFTKDMRQISGFGSGYEAACRKMVLVGASFLENNPNIKPEYKGFKGIYGVISSTNEDAKMLDAALHAVCDDMTGAMHQACVCHILKTRELGWKQYVEEMKKTTIDS